MTHNADNDALDEWRNRLGERLLRITTCTHLGDAFGDGAVCVTCWANVQRIGNLIEAEIRQWSTHALAAGAAIATRPIPPEVKP